VNRGRIFWIVVVLGVLGALYGTYCTIQSWDRIQHPVNEADFTTYYYAWKAIQLGENPYDVEVLWRLAKNDDISRTIQPYFYPPPFLLPSPLVRLPMSSLYLLWFWFDVLLGLISIVLLIGAWHRARPLIPWLVVLAFGCASTIILNHNKGQVNLLILSLVLGGWYALEHRKEVLAGVLVGIACMLKMSPVLFVMWWILRRRWTAVTAAFITGLCLSLITLAVVPWEVQLHFYTKTLPGFVSGGYNRLSVPIDLFGNHSLPDIYNRIWPAEGQGLSSVAQIFSSITLVAVLTGLALAFKRPPADARARAGQMSAVALAMLLVPVYTYEHHLMWVLPAAVAVIESALVGRLSRIWLLFGGFALLCQAINLETLIQLSANYRGDWFIVSELIRESKMASILILFAGTITLGRSGSLHESPRESTV